METAKNTVKSLQVLHVHVLKISALRVQNSEKSEIATRHK